MMAKKMKDTDSEEEMLEAFKGCCAVVYYRTRKYRYQNFNHVSWHRQVVPQSTPAAPLEFDSDDPIPADGILLALSRLKLKFTKFFFANTSAVLQSKLEHSAMFVLQCSTKTVMDS